MIPELQYIGHLEEILIDLELENKRLKEEVCENVNCSVTIIEPCKN